MLTRDESQQRAAIARREHEGRNVRALAMLPDHPQLANCPLGSHPSQGNRTLHQHHGLDVEAHQAPRESVLPDLRGVPVDASAPAQLEQVAGLEVDEEQARPRIHQEVSQRC